jgi:hypothetical protein
LTINAFDADGNAVTVVIAQSSNGDDVVSGNQITGANGSDNPDNESGSATVSIAGPVARIEVFYENIATSTAMIYITDVHFQTLIASDNDVLTGGDGDDTITDFNAGNSGTIQDGDSTKNDFVDLSGYYDNLSELYGDQADDSVLNQSNALDSQGRATDYSDNTQFGLNEPVTFTGASADNSSFTNENTGVTCFTSGTAIRTPKGDVLIDHLRVGDLVTTMDNGPQRICWLGRRHVDAHALRANAKLRPA